MSGVQKIEGARGKTNSLAARLLLFNEFSEELSR
jgi:hypothetical protein